jgi:hypothetical protein
MFRIHTPILIVPTAEAREALGPRLHVAGVAAYRAIAAATKGLEIAHLQFVFGRLTLAICSRIRRDGVVEIELGLGDPRLTKNSPPHRCGRLKLPRGRGSLRCLVEGLRARSNRLAEVTNVTSARLGRSGTDANWRSR